jgi:hypothetical protein
MEGGKKGDRMNIIEKIGICPLSKFNDIINYFLY